MPQGPFPQEIFDDIVDWAAQDLSGCLSELSLASKRHFLERCRRHISNMYFAEPRWLPPGTRKTFHKNPMLLQNVRQMAINHGLPGFKVSEDHFRDVLGRLQDLEALDIDLSFNYEDWTKFGVLTRWPTEYQA